MKLKESKLLELGAVKTSKKHFQFWTEKKRLVLISFKDFFYVDGPEYKILKTVESLEEYYKSYFNNEIINHKK